MAPTLPSPGLKLELKSTENNEGDPREIYIVSSQNYQYQFWLALVINDKEVFPFQSQIKDMQKSLDNDIDHLQGMLRLLAPHVEGSQDALSALDRGTTSDIRLKIERHQMELRQLMMFFKTMGEWHAYFQEHRRPLVEIAEQCIVSEDGHAKKPDIITEERAQEPRN
ncbi:MAG: hypothetical protein Q9169_007790 [Polycauliona sp. 2 TL-2023]